MGRNPDENLHGSSGAPHSVDSNGTVQTPLVQVMGRGIQQRSVEPQRGSIHQGWAVQPQGLGARFRSAHAESAEVIDMRSGKNSVSLSDANAPVSFQSDTATQSTSYSTRQRPSRPRTSGKTATASYQPKRKTGLAAFIIGIAAIVFVFFSVPFGILLGVLAIAMGRKAAKTFGKSGNSTAAVTLGIVGIALGIIVWLSSMALSIAAFDLFTDSDSHSARYTDSTQLYSSDLSSSTYLGDEQDALIEELVCSSLDEIANQDDDTMTWMSQKIDEAFSESGYPLQDMEIDPSEITRWLVTDFSYTHEGSYALSDGTGTVYAEIEVRDWYSLMDTLQDLMDDLHTSEAFASAGQTEKMAYYGEAFTKALNAPATMTSRYASFDVENQNGVWVIDQQSWEEELSYIFGLF